MSELWPCAWTHLKMALCHTRPIGGTYNKYQLPPISQTWQFQTLLPSVLIRLFCINALFIQYTFCTYFLFFCVFFLVPNRPQHLPTFSTDPSHIEIPACFQPYSQKTVDNLRTRQGSMECNQIFITFFFSFFLSFFLGFLHLPHPIFHVLYSIVYSIPWTFGHRFSCFKDWFFK